MRKREREREERRKGDVIIKKERGKDNLKNKLEGEGRKWWKRKQDKRRKGTGGRNENGDKI